jgi:RISC-loading complex subunit TARBP2
MCCNTGVTIDLSRFTGECQCLVMLTTMPIALCKGSGKSSVEAQANAAQNALEYLKIITKE